MTAPSQKKTDRTVEADDNFATRRTQQESRSKAGANGDKGEVRASGSGLHAGLREERRQGSGESGGGEMSMREVDVQTASRFCGSQGSPKGMCVVGRDVSRKSRSLSLERTKRSSV